MKTWSPHYYPYPNSKPKAHKKPLRLSPPAVLFIGFCGLIALGTMLLLLPIAHTQDIKVMQALFTATSAVTVTGLAVLSTPNDFTTFGHLVIASLIQIGGLGFMTITVVVLRGMGQQMDISKQLIAKESFGIARFDQLVDTAKCVLVYALIIESIGFTILLAHWYQTLPLGDAIMQSFFYTISAFNNAGFALHDDSLTSFRGDWVVNLVISGLFVIGGLGFVVLMDIVKRRRWSRFGSATKLVLIATVVLNVLAFSLFWLFEANNPETLGNLPLSEQVITAWMQAVTPRTAGFNSIDFALVNDESTVLTIWLMIIGGGSMSTASGLKITTVVVLLMATYAYLRRRDQVAIGHRQISPETVFKALSLTVVYFFTVMLATLILTITEQANLTDITFEAVSALGTVGLSRGITGSLSEPGEAVIIFLMLIGRLGPLTFLYLIARPKRENLKYAKAEIQVG
ncbi:TrkH family potassium uptake protein [Pseudoalteromonas sp. A22]|uniref:TrkH family potassium uptake protein n=1 Tax=Pseudoalteromonas sp. A22 TaxID=327511 RepID=UPI001BA964BA|nr:TrkH family potassium uptake protein [Pseudoalteromonas sp. A22]